MSHLLWRYFFENDHDRFQHTLARATFNVFTQSKGKSGAGLSTSPGSILATSPTMTKGKRQNEPTHRASQQTSGTRGDGSIVLSRADINWKDAHGLNLLHQIASATSADAAEFVSALLELPYLDLYAQDEESGWTALHRALYFGNITIARALMQRDVRDAMQHSVVGLSHISGGLIKLKDREGYSPFDVYGLSIADRNIRHGPGIPLLGDGSEDEENELAQGVSGDRNDDNSSHLLLPRVQLLGDEVFAFGSNKNFTLGFGDEDDRQFPERIQLKRPDHLMYRFFEEYSASSRINQRRALDDEKSMPFGIFEMPAAVRYRPLTIQDIQLSKLHSAILTNDPESNLYMCGFGSGGRLGTGDETTRFGYVNIHGGGLAGKRVIHVGLGQNHTLAITSEGETFTWGSNAFGQLGYAPSANVSGIKDEESVQLLPRQVFGPLKREVAVGAAASRIHSALITSAHSSSLYTFGKNEGQMGLVDSDARSLISQNTPRKVGASLFASPITSVSAIDRATICLLADHEVWVFANYGYTKVSFPVQSFSNYFLEHNQSKFRMRPTRQAVQGSDICKITSGGETICAMTDQGDVFTMHVSQKAETTTASASTTNPAKIRGALSTPLRVWSLKKAHMAVRDVDVGQDGSIIICTESGSVWRRVKRAKIKDATAVGLSEYKAKDYKFSRVPGLTRIAAVRSNAFGTYAAVRRDCDVTKTQVDVDSTSLWKDLYPLLPFHGFGAEDSDTEEPTPRFWVSSQPDDVASIRRAVISHSNVEEEMEHFLADRYILEDGHFDLQLGTTVSNVRVPIHTFMFASRSAPVARGLQIFRDSYFFSIPDVLTIEYDKDGKPLILLQGVDFITVLNLVLYIYTDSIIDVWHFQRHYQASAHRYRQVRIELMRMASQLEMRKLEHAVRLMTEPPKTLHNDLEMAIRGDEYFQDGDIEIELDGATVLVHGALVCRRCPFFEGMFHGRAAGRWLSPRQDRDQDIPEPTGVDLTHITPEIFRFVLRHIYADADERMFDDIVTADLDTYLDLVIEVMSVANELMLDRLAQCCQKVIGRYVNTRNVCQLLNAVAPCSVTEFKEAALEYICLNLEDMLENHLLTELDNDLMLELDEVVRQNQLSCLPIAKSGRAEADLLDRHPGLAEAMDHNKSVKVDQIRLQSRLREKETRISSTHKASEELLDDFQSPATRKSSRPAARESSTRSPSLRPKSSSIDLMFEMDEDDGSQASERSSLPIRHSRKSQSPYLAPMTETADEESFDGLDPNRAVSGSHSATIALGLSEGAEYASSAEPGSPAASKLPWTNSSVGTPRLDMKEIMAQASSNRTSTLSSSLAGPDKQPQTTRPPLPSKLSQRERKKQQQQQQLQHTEVLRQAQANEILPAASIIPEKDASPWQRTRSGPKVSLKDVIGAEVRAPGSGEKSASAAPQRTPSPMTMRQTVAGKKSRDSSKPTMPSGPPLTRPTSSHSSIPQPTLKRSLSTPNDIGPASTPPLKPSSTLSPPRSVSTYDPPIIQSIRHHHPVASSPKDPEPSIQLSMNDILSQQQTEKQLIRDIVEGRNKRSLEEIQTEQAFQEWWDKERKKVQEEEEEAAAGKGKGKGRRGGRARVRARGSSRGGDGALEGGRTPKAATGGEVKKEGINKVGEKGDNANRGAVPQGRGRGRGGGSGGSGAGGAGQRPPSGRGRGRSRHDGPSKPDA